MADLNGLTLSGGSQLEHANLRTLVHLLKKTTFLQLNRLEVVWPVLHILVENHLSFTKITGLHLEYHPNHHDLYLRAAEILGPRLEQLSLVEASVKYPNPQGYLLIAEAFLQHSNNKLKALVATPSQHQADWLGLVAHYADSLTSLEELTISTLREPNFTDENPVFIDNRPLVDDAHQFMPQLDVPTVTEFQCSPNLLRNNQFLKFTPSDQAIDSAEEVHKILSQF